MEFGGEAVSKIKHYGLQKEQYSFARGAAASFFDQLKFNAAFQRRGAFVNRRCLTCPDHLAELADISLGDAWHKEYSGDTKGLNLAFVRSPNAQRILDDMQNAKRIFTEKIPSAKALQSQKACLLTKKKLAPTISILKRRSICVPQITGQPQYKTTIKEKMAAWMEIKQIDMAKTYGKWRLLPLAALIMAIIRRLQPKDFPEDETD